MYRNLILLLLCAAASPAPQMIDSDITYVKLQPPVEAPTAPSHFRESRIENLPLTIPNIAFNKENISILEAENPSQNIPYSSNEDDKNILIFDAKKASNSSDLTLLESSNVDSIAPDLENDEDETTELPEIYPESISEPEKSTTITDQTFSMQKPDSTVKDLEKSDAIPSETYQSDRRGRTYDSSETTDIFDITERFEDITQLPVTKPPPKFPKVSHFKKSSFVNFQKNSIEKSPLRRFRSHCRCEKIWNCPKLQISVPRCPDEYFLCCF